eukprot:Hpha_TRINITY_DN16868_c2_g1::TRINITY_DN16868_c2_g1_i1::g.152726::m.152726
MKGGRAKGGSGGVQAESNPPLTGGVGGRSPGGPRRRWHLGFACGPSPRLLARASVVIEHPISCFELFPVCRQGHLPTPAQSTALHSGGSAPVLEAGGLLPGLLLGTAVEPERTPVVCRKHLPFGGVAHRRLSGGVRGSGGPAPRLLLGNAMVPEAPPFRRVVHRPIRLASRRPGAGQPPSRGVRVVGGVGVAPRGRLLQNLAPGRWGGRSRRLGPRLLPSNLVHPEIQQTTTRLLAAVDGPLVRYVLARGRGYAPRRAVPCLLARDSVMPEIPTVVHTNCLPVPRRPRPRRHPTTNPRHATGGRHRRGLGRRGIVPENVRGVPALLAGGRVHVKGTASPLVRARRDVLPPLSPLTRRRSRAAWGHRRTACVPPSSATTGLVTSTPAATASRRCLLRAETKDPAKVGGNAGGYWLVTTRGDRGPAA